MFKKGDHAVYPGHGVGTVTRTETKEMLGQKNRFLCLTIRASGMNIMLPINATDQVGLRKIATKAQAREAIRILNAEPKLKTSDTWNKRYREYMESIKTGDLLQIAEVFSAIKKLRVEQELSFGERKMLDNARALLSEEISLVLGINCEEIEGLFEMGA